MPWKPIETASDLIGKFERATCDFKREYDLADPTVPFEIAKDVAALASALGGTILVGAIEGRDDKRGAIVAFKSVVNPGDLVTRVSASVNQKTRPLAVCDPTTIILTTDEQALVLGRPGTPDGVTIVAINVPPLASGPVGVVACDENGKAIDEAYRFPMRGGEGTRNLRPEELAVYTSAHERKIAVLLHQIPGATGTDEPRPEVRVFDVGRKRPTAFSIVRIDDERQLLIVTWTPDGAPKLTAHVPLAFIQSVWVDERDHWCVYVRGRVFGDALNPAVPQFIPEL